jgi:hypothetical protein
MKRMLSDRPNALRRRVTRGGLSIPVVLATFGSRPVLGAAPYNCTISGQLSGNTSSHGAPLPCGMGQSASEVEQEAIANPSLGEIPFGSLTAGGISVAPIFQVVEPTDPNAGGVACAQPPGGGTAVVGGTPIDSGTPSNPVTPRSPKAPRLPRAPREPKVPRESGTTGDAGTIREPMMSEVVWTPASVDKRTPRGDKPPRDRGGSSGTVPPSVSTPSATGTTPVVGSPTDPCAQLGATSPTSAGGLSQPSSPQPPSKPGRRDKTSRKTVIATAAVDPGVGATTRPATIREVLESRDGGLVPLGRATIASFMNATRLAPDYPVTPKQVIEMFNAVYDGGAYQVNATTYWNRDQVQAYFESLFR